LSGILYLNTVYCHHSLDSSHSPKTQIKGNEMRITLDLPDSLLRELQARAMQSGQSLESLLNKLIQQAMHMPATPEPLQQAVAALPTLRSLQASSGEIAKPTPAQSNEQLENDALQEDIEKLRRIGFLR
jgi:hypothetical protein